jgi:hypothetical protein
MSEFNPALLYSMSELDSIIAPLLARLQPRSICEIGIEKGRFTDSLLAFCRENHCSFTGVDVLIEPLLVPLGNGHEARYIKGRSLEVLSTLPMHDVYFIDGDHNYYTVSSELRLIVSGAGRAPFIFLHDVGWPCGRRDMYYQPESIPAGQRHPYRAGVGPVPGQQELEEWGLSSKYGDMLFSVAEVEGGCRNGVRTAIEDFLKEPAGAGWQLLVVPAVFGLGILYLPGRCSPAVISFLQQLSESVALLGSVLGKVEENRVQMFASFMRGFHHSTALMAEYRSLQKAYDALRIYSNELLAACHDAKAQMRRGAEKNT